jgi:hypothetical protein
MAFPNEITCEMFDRVTIRERWQPDLAGMYDHFNCAISQARREFLRERRGVWDVHTLNGFILRGNVKLEENGQFAQVWRENGPGDAPSRVPVVMGMLPCSFV